MSEQPDRERFEQLLLCYVNGRLDEAQHAWMDRFVEAHPEVAGDLEMEQALRDVLREGLPEASADDGLPQFMERLQNEIAATMPSSWTQGPAPSWWNRFKESMTMRPMAPAWVTVTVLLVVQTGIIGMLLADRSTSLSGSGAAEWRSVGEISTTQQPVLQITFKPTATEAEMRLLLVKIGGMIIGGPGQLGQYIVRVPTDTLDATAKSLEGNDILESVQVRTEIPKEE